jgi:MFS transporter, FHS family, glucose/mannose:H+ symporter
MQQPGPRAHFALYLGFFALAISFGSAQFVVDKSFEYNVARSEAVQVFVLQQVAAFFTAFFLSAFVPSAGHKRVLLFILALLCIVGGLMPLKGEWLNQMGVNFLLPEIFYFVTGIGFGLVKVIVYSYAYFLCPSEHAHASMLNRLEAWYMLGSLAGLVLFGGLSLNPSVNLEVHYVFVPVVLATLGIAYLVYRAPLAQAPHAEDLRAEYGQAYPLAGMVEVLKLLPYTLVALFALGLFLVAATESYFFHWLPVYLRGVVQLSELMQVQFLVVALGMVALGRFVMSYLVRMSQPHYWVLASIGATLGLLALLVSLANGMPAGLQVEYWADVPDQLFFFLVLMAVAAPIAPTLVATALWHTPAPKRAAMMGLVVMTNIGGVVVGTALASYFLGEFGPVVALSFAALPLALMLTIALLLLADIRRGKATATS